LSNNYVQGKLKLEEIKFMGSLKMSLPIRENSTCLKCGYEEYLYRKAEVFGNSSAIYICKRCGFIEQYAVYSEFLKRWGSIQDSEVLPEDAPKPTYDDTPWTDDTWD
jgi:predicted nucleic-acid-binding Zn-ribbon protein